MTPALIILAELILVLGCLLLADRWLHRHLQALMFLLTGDPEIALWLYALLLLPGAALHEISHAITAWLLLVRIGQINVLPKRMGKRIRLGFVTVEQTDFVRSSLIGAAPLFFGGTVVAALGYYVFGTPEMLAALRAGDWPLALRQLRTTTQVSDVWLWAYLLFTISNTMLPSKSDVRAWPWLGLTLAVALELFLWLGDRSLILGNAVQFLTLALRWIVLLGGTTLLIDVPFFALIFLLERLIAHLKGVEIIYT